MDSDLELLLLCWAQLSNALFLTQDKPSYKEALLDVETRLFQEMGIHSMQLVARTLDIYTVSYQKDDQQQIIQFPTQEVEDFA